MFRIGSGAGSADGSLSERLGELERQLNTATASKAALTTRGTVQSSPTRGEPKATNAPIQGVAQLFHIDARRRAGSRRTAQGSGERTSRELRKSPTPRLEATLTIRRNGAEKRRLATRIGWRSNQHRRKLTRTLTLAGTSLLIMTSTAFLLPMLAPRDEAPLRVPRSLAAATPPQLADRIAAIAGMAENVSLPPARSTAFALAPAVFNAQSPEQPAPLTIPRVPTDQPTMVGRDPEPAPSTVPSEARVPKAARANRVFAELNISREELGNVQLPLSVLGTNARAEGAALLVQGLPSAASMTTGLRVAPGTWTISLKDFAQTRLVLPRESPARLDLVTRVIAADGEELSVANLRVTVKSRTTEASSTSSFHPTATTTATLRQPSSREKREAVAALMTEQAANPPVATTTVVQPAPAAKRRPLRRTNPAATAQPPDLPSAATPSAATKRKVDQPPPANGPATTSTKTPLQKASGLGAGGTIPSRPPPRQRSASPRSNSTERPDAVARTGITNMPGWAPFGANHTP